jgi:hypothetical protein
MMKQIAYLAICFVVVLSMSACGEAPVSWNEAEDNMYQEFLSIQSQVKESISHFHSNAPSSYQDSKHVADFVWDWKGFENSCIEQIYSQWRQSAGIAIERVAGMHFYKESDPNIATVRSEAAFHENDWIENTERVEQAVIMLKEGSNPLVEMGLK